MITIRRGLDLPINGKPEQVISESPAVQSVAIVGPDYNGMKPTMAVKEGDTVKLGQLLFTDKKTDGVRYTSPASGVVSAINRGARRVLESVVIDLKGDDKEDFDQYAESDLENLERQKVVDNLVLSGAWTSLRTRPYSKVPAIDSIPASIFVTAIDTNPLAVDPNAVIPEEQAAFDNGIKVLTRLTEGKVFVCTAENTRFSVIDHTAVVAETFAGVHPAGNAGTHIHHLDPVNVNKTVWTIGYQDVIAFGHLFVSGELYTRRVISLAGPRVNKPRLIETRIGANLESITAGNLNGENNRVISGSVFGGRTANGSLAFLGRYHNQVSVLEEGDNRLFMHYLRAGFNAFSTLGIYVSSLMKGKTFDFTTTTNGSERAMVPIGAYENIMPLDILPTQLLRSLIVGDTEMAQKLGCLELDEEDLALCTYVCPGKYEYGPILRDNLTRIETEG
ncbi:Na(+)-translocating NADH-quinone reductase subunit A [Eionea flava]